MKQDVAQNLAASMSSDTVDIIPYLPYLLQDFWELGSSPSDMAAMLADFVPQEDRTRALDLGCGKGAVSIELARALGMHVKGIDAMPSFLAEARTRAAALGLSDLCTFEAGDIVEAVLDETGYDVTVYGAVGDVLGSQEHLIASLKETVRPGGYLLIDDAYRRADAQNEGTMAEDCLSLDEWNELFEQAGATMLSCRPSSDSQEDYDRELAWIERRASELMGMHPDDTGLFERYVEAQRAEYIELLADIVGATWLLRVP